MITTTLSPAKPIPRNLTSKPSTVTPEPTPPTNRPQKQPPDFELMAVPIFRAAFIMTENKMTKQARDLINSIPSWDIYETATKISEGKRMDKNAVLFRYVFKAIEITPQMNSFNDLRTMRLKLLKTERAEFNRLYNIYKRKPSNRCPCEFLPLFPC